MRLFLALLISLLLMALAAACTTPPPTEEQLRAYAQYAELRATDAAASELIAAAKATEAAAVQQIAQATAAALPPPAAIATLTPTLVVTASGDRTVRPETQRALAQGIPNARQAIVHNAGHAVIIDQPQEFNRLLLNFFESVR